MKAYIKEYSFDNRSDIWSFIESNKERIINQRIKTTFSIYGMWGYPGEWPAVIVFDDFAVGISCERVNRAFIEIVPPKLFGEYVDSFEGMLLETEDFPFKGEEIESISVKGFSKSYEINAVSGEKALEGGDYFSTIRIHLKNGFALCFCGASAICDGWMDVWVEG